MVCAMSHAEALACVERGDFAEALVVARAAMRDGHPGEVGLTIAWIELELGRPRSCQKELRKAAERGASPARVKCLNGLRLCAVGSYELAVAELSAARESLGDDPRWLANALVGRGIARVYLHRFGGADRDFEDAGRILKAIGEAERAAVCLHNRGFVALQAGDVPTALQLFDEAASGLRRGRGEALIDRAGALLAAGMARDASVVIDQAAEMLAGRGSRLAELALTAGYCALRSGDVGLAAVQARRAQELFRAQRRPAWVAAADALELRTKLPHDLEAVRRVADRCSRWGRRLEAAELLVAAGLLEDVQAERFAKTARLRAIGWLARARLAKDNRGVFAACRAGMRVVAENPAVLGAAELADTALGVARRPRTVLKWIEWQRISVSPTADSADVVALRAAESSGDMRKVAEIERRLSASQRTSLRAGCVDELIAALGDKAFVSFGVRNGELVACTVVDSKVRVRGLGKAAEIRAEVTAFRFGAGRLDVLDSLVRYLPIGDRELVVVPAKGMSGLVWAALPSCVGRAVSVAPSAEGWLRARCHNPGVGTVSVAGPGLAHAEREAVSVGGDVVLTGRASTVDATLAAIDGADIVHIAAHGKFRRDAPMFSSLQLADGPLYAYDLDRLKRMPRVVVLSACEVARSDAIVGRRGQALIASAFPVPDDEAVDLITAFHQGLSRCGPAQALAQAQVQFGHMGFNCFGAG